MNTPIYLEKQVVEEKPSIFKPNDLTEEEMKYLLEQSSKGFLLVLSADRAQILFVTDSISDFTNHSPVSNLIRLIELLDFCLFLYIVSSICVWKLYIRTFFYLPTSKSKGIKALRCDHSNVS